MVEKPDPANAPSNFYINGRYILQPEIFELLGQQQRGAGNEIQLTDAMVRAVEGPAVLRLSLSRAARSTAAPRKASSRPTSPSRWRATT